MTASHERPERGDIAQSYRLFLGRDPESETVVDELHRHAGADWAAGFLGSSEFKTQVIDKVVRAEDLAGSYFGAPPGEELRDWAAARLPISTEAAAGVRRAENWYALFHALFSDAVFAGTVPAETGVADPAFLGTLRERHALALLGPIEGEVESFSAAEVRGWAVNRREPDRLLPLELLCDGRFVAGGATGLFRRDLQGRFGGRGDNGFLIPLPAGAAGFGRYEVREAASRRLVGSFLLPSAAHISSDAVAQMRQELAALRATLDRIETRLPSFHAAMGFPLTSYDEYFRAYYLALDRGVGSGTVPITAIVDAVDADAPRAEGALGALIRGAAPERIILVHDAGDARLDMEELVDRFRMRVPGGVRVVALAAVDGWAAAMTAAVARADHDHLLLLRASGRVAPDAPRTVWRALQSGAGLVFADEDSVSTAPGGLERHHDPVLRGAYDPDLMMQHDAVGDLIGVTRALACQAPLGRHGQAVALQELALRAGAAATGEGVVHLPRILFHRSAAPGEAQDPRPARLAMVRDHLAERNLAADAEAHADALGAEVPAALRVRWRVRPETRVAIIIPTRDRLDLLGPCLASIAASRDSNRVAVEIIVVDNRSAEPETEAFLRGFSGVPGVRAITHDGAFNWASINNRATASTDADVLVFLNNDTVVLTQDGWDELAGQALRADVGAVGARLLYEDGTIQHAGMVMDEWHSFARHDGVGVPGSEAGYLGRNALVHEVATVTGACLATRATLFRESGGFDAAFPVEGSDTDYCLRLRSRGLRILYDPFATFYHFESKTRGYNLDEEKRAIAFRATQALRERHAARFEHDPFYNPHFDRLAPPFTKLVPPPRLASDD